MNEDDGYDTNHGPLSKLDGYFELILTGVSSCTNLRINRDSEVIQIDGLQYIQTDWCEQLTNDEPTLNMKLTVTGQRIHSESDQTYKSYGLMNSPRSRVGAISDW
jgi:hypothetical protein